MAFLYDIISEIIKGGNKMIKIIADSTSYLPKELIEKFNIDIVPLSVILGDEVIVENQISNIDFFEKLEQSTHHPTSSQPTVGDVYNAFEKYIKKGDNIVFISISAQMSGTYTTAVMVKNMIIEKYPKAEIEIIDSKSNCMQFGYAVLAGAKAADKGENFNKTVDQVNYNIARSRMLFIPDDLKYLQKSGRLSKASALAASVLKIVPILTVMEGKADVFAKIRTRKKAKETMLSELQKDIDNNNVASISVMHINNEDEATNFIKEINKRIDISINLTSIGPVIGAHVGPGTVGIVWCRK